MASSSSPSLQFASQASPGDPVSVLILVEDSQAMAANWPDVRTYYLPKLLDSLRTADLSVPMRLWWLTSSPSFSPFTTPITHPAQCNELPDLGLGLAAETSISTSTIRRSMNIYASSNKPRRGSHHLVIVAASPLLGGGEGPSPMQSGIDPWLGMALALCQVSRSTLPPWPRP
ncbi:uncharacterized protein FIBRA_09214 [Fibroporia radiculosa]|uniref:Mediator of RNA polymerase II transcription subunit 25 n=1 Tax=Fibroporia radiculosa TaxID=599839 RepID=J7SCU0_9APHY|nr:uncharacterized protein FIBRA_09214 [Fibroporia radiculosa]CCM06903.1 predicted protein [Fibroporia radiculosa]